MIASNRKAAGTLQTSTTMFIFRLALAILQLEDPFLGVHTKRAPTLAEPSKHARTATIAQFERRVMLAASA